MVGILGRHTRHLLHHVQLAFSCRRQLVLLSQEMCRTHPPVVLETGTSPGQLKPSLQPGNTSSRYVALAHISLPSNKPFPKCQEEVIMSQQPNQGESSSPVESRTPADQFLINAGLGSNRWWRWVLGFIATVLAWIGMGSLVLPLVGCAFLQETNAFGLSCSDAGITGDHSLIAQIVVGGLGFLIGLLGLWAVVRLIHKKPLTRVVTGRSSFKYQRGTRIRIGCGPQDALLYRPIGSDEGNPQEFLACRLLHPRPWRISLSVVWGRIASGSTRRSSTAGTPAASACSNAAGKSSVRSTVAPKPPKARA